MRLDCIESSSSFSHQDKRLALTSGEDVHPHQLHRRARWSADDLERDEKFLMQYKMYIHFILKDQ